MRMRRWHSRENEESLQRSLPIPDRALDFRFASPEEYFPTVGIASRADVTNDGSGQ
jgi:hypothetical protein